MTEVQQLGLCHLEALAPIAANRNAMKFVGTGEPWTHNKLRRRLVISGNDWLDGKTGERGYAWAIVQNDRTVGAVIIDRTRDDYSAYFFMLPGVNATHAMLDAVHLFGQYEPRTGINASTHPSDDVGATLLHSAHFIEGPPGFPLRLFFIPLMLFDDVIITHKDSLAIKIFKKYHGPQLTRQPSSSAQSSRRHHGRGQTAHRLIVQQQVLLDGSRALAAHFPRRKNHRGNVGAIAPNPGLCDNVVEQCQPPKAHGQSLQHS